MFSANMNIVLSTDPILLFIDAEVDADVSMGRLASLAISSIHKNYTFVGHQLFYTASIDVLTRASSK